MTTLGTLKATIRTDIFREDLDVQIGEAIRDSIRHYGRRRFFFNETRDGVFSTVPGKARYGRDVAPNFVIIDALFITGPDGYERPLCRDRMPAQRLSPAPTAYPTHFDVYGMEIGLYPTPAAVYQIRGEGQIIVPGPETDDEEGNVWMTEAFELIRCRSKAYLFAHHMQEPQMAGVYASMEADERAALDAEGASRTGTGFIEPTSF